MRSLLITPTLILGLSLLSLNMMKSAKANDTSEKLAEFVSTLPRGSLDIPLFWLEMESTIGWEKMMLLFGYADNRTVCKQLSDMARKDAPARRFRCSPAN
jgi:hypothetical protein